MIHGSSFKIKGFNSNKRTDAVQINSVITDKAEHEFASNLIIQMPFEGGIGLFESK